MDEYGDLRKHKLVFKGDKKKKHKKPEKEGVSTSERLDRLTHKQDDNTKDADDHGGWYELEGIDRIDGYVAIEISPQCYAKALSNGRIVLGDPHGPGDQPEEEEIFTAVRIPPNKLAFKSGFDRYLGIGPDCRIVGLSEAIGEREQFVIVFEDGQSAICASNGCFVSLEDSEEVKPIVARSQEIDPLKIRVSFNPRRS